MESLHATLLCLFLSLIFLSVNLLFYMTKPRSTGPTPPGRTGWPYIGETLDFLSTGWKGHPEKFIFDRMAKYSPHVFKTHLLGERVAVLCGPAGNKFLFSNENKLVQAWWPSSVNKLFPSSTNSSCRDEATKLRKLLPNFFKPEALHRYVGIMDHTARRHFADMWDHRSQVLVFPLAKNFTFRLACRIFLSIEDPREVDKLADKFDLVSSGMISIPIDFPGTPFRKGVKASGYIRKELVSIIRRRRVELAEGRASASQDILSHMLVARDEQDGRFMGDLEVAVKILGLLVGGHDTASSVCTFVVKYLAELPLIYDGVYKEQMEIVKSKGDEEELLSWDDLQKMKYSWKVACEVLRLAPPIQGTFREAIVDFSYNGFSIPKGWKLYWGTNSTQKNPEYFREPERFEPSRFEGSGPAPYTFVPFGGGPNMCPGKEYARLKILVFMHNIVKRFKWEKVIPDEKIVVDLIPIPAKGLPVRLYPH